MWPQPRAAIAAREPILPKRSSHTIAGLGLARCWAAKTRQPRQEITVAEKRKLAVGMLLYPGMTQLDLTGPYEVFCRMPDTSVSLLSATSEPVRTEWGLTITPDRVFADSEAQDILCVPGGWGVNEQL